LQSAELWLFKMRKVKNKKIICFDIDNTLCFTKKNYYNRAKPNLKAIEALNELYSQGYYIKLFTSRFMGRNKENAIKAKKQGYNFTKKQLKKWNVRHDKLILGKPSYDVLVDDKCIFYKKNWYELIKKKI
jgi:hypothetical protein